MKYIAVRRMFVGSGRIQCKDWSRDCLTGTGEMAKSKGHMMGKAGSEEIESWEAQTVSMNIGLALTLHFYFPPRHMGLPLWISYNIKQY